MEAERLAVYFEEVGAYQKKKMREAERSSPESSSGERTEFIMEDQETLVWVEDE